MKIRFWTGRASQAMRNETNEISDSKISIHDKHRFEIKLDIELPAQQTNSYRLETYFFIPRALNISPSTYSKEMFYNSIQRYIRFKTPRFSLPRITDPSVEMSPFVRIRKNIPAILSGTKDKEITETVFNETKLLGAVTKGAIRDFVKHLLREMALVRRSGASGARFKMLEEMGAAFVRDVEAYIAAIHELKEEVLNPAVPLKLHEAFLFFDEFISITIQDYLSILLQALRSSGGLDAELNALDQAFAKVILGQQSYRKSMGYPSVLSGAKTDSTLLYRRSVLKKFISNVLFLNMEFSEWEGLSQIPLAIAAGFAMLFAATAAVFAQTRYTTNSIPFVVVIVVSYIFKDRLKDWLKLYFTKGLVRWTADRKIRIRDPYSGQVIGNMKEAFSFVEQGRIPAEVLYRRNLDNITSIDEEGKPERVIKYEKEVALFPMRISRFHERRRDLNDIMRLNIDDFLKQADDPTAAYLHLNSVSGQLERSQCRRVYHVNLILKYNFYDAQKHARFRFQRIRLILNRNGIVKLEEVMPLPGQQHRT
jgi:hypothetical protein